jgi:fructose-bisphosphate aldolase, class I
MELTDPVKRILSYYESDNPGTKANLARILLQGRLGGTGKLLILPVDQGVEHGPARSFAPNPPAYDSHYHYQLALEAGLSAYAAPLGFIEGGADTFAGRIPTILKLNNANSMSRFKENATQAITGSVRDALRLGCSAIGFTIYPGSDAAYDQMRDIAEMACEAKAHGLAVVIWSYPRGGNLSREGETAIDICAYAAQIAAQLGAHIIKVKPPTQHLELAAAKAVYEKQTSTYRPRPRASAMSCSPPLTAAASSFSRAARQRTSTASSPRCARSATAAATVRSSAATPSSARSRRRWTCSARSSKSTKAKTEQIRGCHCERSEAISKHSVVPDRDCFVAALLAMTWMGLMECGDPPTSNAPKRGRQRGST